MSEKKYRQLKSQDLDKVTGGTEWGDEHDDYLPAGHGQHISKYADSYIGQKVYAVCDRSISGYCFGTLINSYEKENGCGTLRYHSIQIESASRDRVCYSLATRNHPSKYVYFTVGATVEIPGNSFTLYLEK